VEGLFDRCMPETGHLPGLIDGCVLFHLRLDLERKRLSIKLGAPPSITISGELDYTADTLAMSGAAVLGGPRNGREECAARRQIYWQVTSLESPGMRESPCMLTGSLAMPVASAPGKSSSRWPGPRSVPHH
jgi:hypothetical protein